MIGKPVRRVEDPHLVTGHGRYAGDVHFDRLLHMAVLRSYLPHARIQRIEAGQARRRPGVVAVWTVEDLPVPARTFQEEIVAPELAHVGRPTLASGIVRYVGEPIAVVFAENQYVAFDALSDLQLELEELPAVATAEAALEPGAPRIHEEFERNLARSNRATLGDAEAAFAGAAHVVRDRFRWARVCAAAMEPRASTARPHGAGVMVWSSTQAVFMVRRRLAHGLALPEADVVVLAEDVGGGFGPKGNFYAEDMLVASAAHRLGRPVTWTATRSEDLMTTIQARGTRGELELAADAEGRLLGLRGTLLQDVGAYPSTATVSIQASLPHFISAYKLPAMDLAYEAVFTNTVPTGSVRGGSRPLGNYGIERMMDRLADRLGVDHSEIRRRNLIQPHEFPYDTGYGGPNSMFTYDSGDYPRLLETTLARLSQKPSADIPAGRWLTGVGLAMCVEQAGGSNNEVSRVVIRRDGIARLSIGSTAQGHGHVTSAAQILADRLGWPFDRIEVVQGDTRAVSHGYMAAGSRTGIHVGNSVSLTARAARADLLARAAADLEVDVADVEMVDGRIQVRGVPARRIDVVDLVPHDGLEYSQGWNTATPQTFPSACHGVEVAVDQDTGQVVVLRYVITHDVGREINPMIVGGQVLGGLVHGVSIALLEEAIYSDGAAFLTPTFLDYQIASPPEVDFEIDVTAIETLSPNNPEGIKGVAESASIPSLAVVARAVEDAVRKVNPKAVLMDLPITPESVLAQIRPSPHGRASMAGASGTSASDRQMK